MNTTTSIIMGGKDKADGGDGGDPKRDGELAAAVNRCQLLTVKLEATERARNDFRTSCKRVADENRKLHDALYQAERDTIEVISYLKKEDMVKDEQIAHLGELLRNARAEARAEAEQMMKETSTRMVELEKQVESKTNEVKMMQGELKLVKEFRKKRTQMQAELDGIRESLFETNKQHKVSLERMEQKFFDEKMRLEAEANSKLSDLAERAHDEAIAKLDETTRNTFKENQRLSASLSTHIKETELLQRSYDELRSEAAGVRSEKELAEATALQKLNESKKCKKENLALRAKVAQLETAVANMIGDFEEERKRIEVSTLEEVGSSRDEIKRLQRIIKLKDQECNRMKIVARNIVKERSDLETFFHQALQQVRDEIGNSRARYVTAAKDAYHRKMLAATQAGGAGEFPKVRTFTDNQHSTNSVMDDLKAAADTSKLEGKQDISQLSWEQKEKVLRLLFARMNRVKRTSSSNREELPAPRKKQPENSEELRKKIVETSLDEEQEEGDPVSTTFLTQQDTTTTTTTTRKPQDKSPGGKLPAIVQKCK